MTSSGVLAFLLRRLAQLAAQVLAISAVIFALLYLSPGSVEQMLLGDQPMTPETVHAVRSQYHLDDPLPVQYGLWLEGAARLDFGTSIRTNEPVATNLARAIPVTFELILYGFVIAMTGGILFGLLAGLRRFSAIDRSIVGLSVVGVSSPAFVSGLVLLYVFGIIIPIFPIYGQGETLLAQLWHLTLPALALALTAMALVIKLTRAAVIDALQQDYVVFAWARGLSRMRVLTRYVLRNSLTAIATAGGLIFNRLLFATVLVEVTFALPGLGSLLIDSVNFKDMPVVQGLGMLFAVIIIAVNILVDLAYLLIDPRIRFTRVAA
jgi:peptide/nickel transport system permease protein